MSVLQLGEREFALTAPDDLGARILASTGLALDEAGRLLLVGSPALLASAILPLLSGDDAPNRAELGELLASADWTTVIASIAPFYDAAPAAVEQGEDHVASE